MGINGAEITVLGGGIAGLACACALAQRGARVRVFERAAELAEVGAGLQLSPNGLAVLKALGLAAALRDRGDASAAVVLRAGATGAQLLRMDMAANGFWLAHRADLIAVLAEGARAAGVEVLTGRAVREVTLEDAGARLDMHEGAVVRTGLLVGADGVRSVLRGVVNGAAAAFFTGQVAWRALIPATGRANVAEVFVGPGRHLVRYPLARRGLVNLVGVEERSAWAEESWSAEDDPAHFRAAFAGFCAEVRRDLAAVDRVNLWGLFRHPVADQWHKGHAALIGDAAHPTLPFLAQGANLALEDAWVLADCLADRPAGAPVEPALARYQARRETRVRRAIAAANGNARNYHLSRWWETLPAHMALRLLNRTAPSLMVRRFDWLYHHDVTRD